MKFRFAFFFEITKLYFKVTYTLRYFSFVTTPISRSSGSPFVRTSGLLEEEHRQGFGDAGRRLLAFDLYLMGGRYKEPAGVFLLDVRQDHTGTDPRSDRNGIEETDLVEPVIDGHLDPFE